MAHLDALARQPRPAGSAAAREAREYCARQLRSTGFRVVERPFEYSALPGRLGAPIIGGVGAVLVVSSLLIGYGHVRLLAACAAITAAAVVVVTSLIGGRGATRWAMMRRQGVNLEATRGDNPRVWLVAHVDSKSQPISTAVRTLGVVLLAAAVCALPVLAALTNMNPGPGLPVGVAVSAVLGGGILVMARVGATSDGAADNASGVAAVLDAVSMIDGDKPVGVLITDAEEVALAGARAWVAGRAPGIAVNCDTVDDEGQFVIMRYRRSQALSAQARDAAGAVDQRARVIRPLPGVLTDSVAFEAAGWDTVTLSHGTLRTLTRIHTVRDNLDAMRGTAIPAAARVLARLIEELA